MGEESDDEDFAVGKGNRTLEKDISMLSPLCALSSLGVGDSEGEGSCDDEDEADGHEGSTTEKSGRLLVQAER